jgi:hypothetical protein
MTYGHPKSQAGILLCGHKLTSRSNLFVIALATLSIFAFVITVRHSSRDVGIYPVHGATKSILPPPASLHATQASPEAKEECSYERYLYPEWPKGFNVSVQAAFILGALIPSCCFSNE